MDEKTREVFEEWDSYAKEKELRDREIELKKIMKNSKTKIISITGVRRAGKTSILMLLRQMLEREKENTAYINLEDNRIKEKNALDNALKRFGDSGYLILDEITSIKGWENWLSRNHEMLKGKLNLIVSSSRKSLSQPKKSLRGRILPTEVFPLSFKEFLSFKNIKPGKTTAGKGEIEKELKEYLVYGGFPEAVLLKDKTEKVRLLNSYFRDIIGLDIADISNENISLVETFGKYVINTTYFSASKCLNFLKSLGYKIGKQSILDLEKISNESYLFFFSSIYSKNIKDQKQYPRKAYLGDTGLYYSIQGDINNGQLYENAVFLELRRKLGGNENINYWKNKKGSECDFVIRKGLNPNKIIQVCCDIKKKDTKNREIKGLVECARHFNLDKGIIITKEYESREKIDGIDIRFIPLRKWLIE